MEFATANDEYVFDTIAFWGLPISILFSLTGTLRRTNSMGAIIAKIVLTVFVALIPVFVAFATALDLCGWTTDKSLFVMKNDSATKIVLRDFGCGAVDSTSPDYVVVKVKYLTSHFIWISNIDTTKIDRSVWHRIEN